MAPAQPQPGKEGGSHGQRRQTCAGPQQPGSRRVREQFGQGKQQPEPHPESSPALTEFPEAPGQQDQTAADERKQIKQGDEPGGG